MVTKEIVEEVLNQGYSTESAKYNGNIIRTYLHLLCILIYKRYIKSAEYERRIVLGLPYYSEETAIEITEDLKTLDIGYMSFTPKLDDRYHTTVYFSVTLETSVLKHSAEKYKEICESILLKYDKYATDMTKFRLFHYQSEINTTIRMNIHLSDDCLKAQYYTNYDIWRALNTVFDTFDTTLDKVGINLPDYLYININESNYKELYNLPSIIDSKVIVFLDCGDRFDLEEIYKRVYHVINTKFYLVLKYRKWTMDCFKGLLETASILSRDFGIVLYSGDLADVDIGVFKAQGIDIIGV